jgi:serine/threonine protein kinase
MKNVNIIFPKSICLYDGKFQIDLEATEQNTITIDGVFYLPYFLDNSKPGNSGANGCILKLIDLKKYNKIKDYPLIPDLVIKVCKYSIPKWKEESQRSKRFEMEIEALVDCNKHNFPNLMTVYHYGKASIRWSDLEKNRNADFRFYTMDYADSKLSGYLETNNLNLLQRLELCIEICESLKQIWSRKYYHRDIKPDNILFIEDKWAISDLGLVDHRDQTMDLDGDGEWIGPRGWMSPEALNKFLAESKPWNSLHNCKINHQSDIYQIGKVLWYILQGNSPEGGIRRSDFLWKNNNIYQVIRTMLNNSQERRIKSIEEVIIALKKEQKRLFKMDEVELLY